MSLLFFPQKNLHLFVSLLSMHNANRRRTADDPLTNVDDASSYYSNSMIKMLLQKYYNRKDNPRHKSSLSLQKDRRQSKTIASCSPVLCIIHTNTYQERGVSRHSDHVPIHSFVNAWHHGAQLRLQATYHGTVVTSLVCGTLSPFAIFIHPRIVITCYARCRMPACMLRVEVIKPSTDDDFFETQSHGCHRHSTVETCPTCRLSRCSSPKNAFKSLTFFE